MDKSLHVITTCMIFCMLFLLTPAIAAQNKVLSGKVKDASGESLIGVNVVQKGTSNGTVTDIDGNFSLRVPDNSIIAFSYIGFESQERRWDGISFMDVILNEDVAMLDDVVVIGAYGTAQKRSDMVGSAFQVNSERIETLPVGRIDNLLEGMVPGLQVLPNSDDASSTKQRLNLRVRGEGSMSASNEPLWIVDGTRIFSGDRTNMVSGMSISVSPLSYINAEEQSLAFLEKAKRINAPIYYAIGNHDHFALYNRDIEVDHPLYGKKYFEKHFGERYYSYDHKGWHFITLDNMTVTEDRKYIGRLDSIQLDWLQKDL